MWVLMFKNILKYIYIRDVIKDLKNYRLIFA